MINYDKPYTEVKMKSSIINHQQPLEVLASAGRFGVIALATDFNIETDLAQLYPNDVRFFTTRVSSLHPLTIENLRKMEPLISDSAANILPGTALDVIIYACTSGTIAIGVKRIAQLIHNTHPNIAVTNPVVAALAAFQHFSVKRISILTPYTKAVNQEMAEFFVSQGVEVLSITGFGFEDDTAMSFINPQDIYQAALTTTEKSAELLFISCTALRASTVLNKLEKKLNIPVISSNQLLAWHSLKLVKYSEGQAGFGSLLEHGLTN